MDVSKRKGTHFTIRHENIERFKMNRAGSICAFCNGPDCRNEHGWSRADAVMTTSSLLRHGVGHMRTLLNGLPALLAARGIGSVEEIRGLMSRKKLKNPPAFERANYVHILQGYHIAPRIDPRAKT